jgi:transposase InsO family protein
MKRRWLDTLALKALVKATHLLGLALAERLRQYRDARDPLVDRFGQLHEHALHGELLRESLSILGSRWDKLPDRQRPHYPPEARFRILRLRALLALSAQETARTFRVSTTTVLRWEQEAAAEPDRETVGSLLKPSPPVRRFADVVRHLVQTLSLAGFPGDRSVALVLARAGWRVSRRTVQRVRREKPVAPPSPPIVAPATHAVRACFPHHVWMLDITQVSSFLRLFSFKLAVVFDVFSRTPLAARAFLREPSGQDIARLLRRAAERFGAPRHSVSDQGAQFTSRVFQRTLARLGIQHRYGAIGMTGSIALIERFFRTVKTTASLRTRPPLLRSDLERRLALTFLYYVWLRPHQGLGGATPAERHLGFWPAHLAAVPPPRGRPEARDSRPLPFEVRYLDPEQRLPYLASRAA